MIKSLIKLGLKGNFLNLIKQNYGKPTANFYIRGGNEKPLFKIRNKVNIFTLVLSNQH